MRAMAAIGAAVVGLVLGGCVSSQPRHETVIALETEWVEGDAIETRTGNGSVRLVRDDSLAAVEIEATLRSRSLERLDDARVVVERAGGVLALRVDWPGGRKSAESASLVVRSPEAFGVSADTGNGSVLIAGHSGPFVVDTTNGSVTLDVTGATGVTEASVETSNGRVRAFGVGRGGPVEVSTSNGRVQIELDDAAKGPADVRTANGSVELVVGRAFRGAIRCSTANGSVRAEGGAELVRTEAGWVVRLPEGAEADASTIRTSNGSIVVRAPGLAETL